MRTLKKLLQVKKMTTQLVPCLIIRTSKKSILIVIDLSKQQALDVDLKAIQQINFTGNIDREGNTSMFFTIKEIKETVLDFSQGTVKVLQTRSANLFVINIQCLKITV